MQLAGFIDETELRGKSTAAEQTINSRATSAPWPCMQTVHSPLFSSANRTLSNSEQNI
jgi:hypothetical protein